MKRLLTVVTLITLIVFAVSCSGAKTETKDITALLPADTLALVQFESTESFIKTMGFMFNCDMCEKAGVSTLKEKLGIDLTNAASFTDKGIDIKKGFGIALTDASIKKDQNSVSVLVYFPVTDEKLVAKKIAEHMPAEKVEKKGHIMTLKTKKEGFEMGYWINKGYLMVGMAYNSKLDSLLNDVKGKLLKDNPVYKELKSISKPGKTLFAYVNTAIMPAKFAGYADLMKKMSKNPWNFNNFKYLDAYKAGYISLDVKTKDLMVDTHFILADNNKVTKLFEGVKFDKKPVLSISEAPVMFASMGLNMVEYYNMVLDGLPAEKKQEAEEKVKNVAGINLYTDLIENLAGNINLGIYDGKSINMTNYNIVLSFTYKNEDVMTKLIDKLIGLMPEKQRQLIKDETVAGVKSKVLMAPFFQMYMGMKDSSFILALNKRLYEKAVAGDVATGFVNKLKDADLKKSLEGNSQSFYFSVPEAMNIYSNFTAVMGGKGKLTAEQVAAINKLGYMYSKEARSKKHIEQHMIMRTNFSKPFMEGIGDMVKLFDKKKEEATPPPPPAK